MKMYIFIIGLVRKLEIFLLKFNISIQIERKRKIDFKKIFLFLKKNRPVKLDNELIRFGGDGDGGYLIPDDLNNIKFCFSPGVSDNANFELELFNSYKIHSYLSDYSVEQPPIKCKGFKFIKKYLNSYDDEINHTLSNWVNSVENDNNMILQMDIEGYEYETLICTDIDILKKFRIIIIEFHHFQSIFNEYGFRMINSIFDKLSSQFYIAHIHPNSTSQLYKHKNIQIPSILEYTFIRKDRVKSVEFSSNFPHKLDHDQKFKLPKSFFQFK